MSKQSSLSTMVGQNKESHQQLVISPRQSLSLISSTIIGVGVLSLPRVAAMQAQEAGWLVAICGALFAVTSVVILTRLGIRFQYQSIVEYSAKVLGGRTRVMKFVGRALSLPIIVGLFAFWLVSVASVSRAFGEVVVTAVLKNTPIEVIILTMLGTALIIVMYDVEVLTRVNEILLPIIIIPIVFIALFSFQKFELEQILPVWPNVPLKDFWRGAMLTMFAYQGHEILTVFQAHTHITNKYLRFNVLGVMIPAVIYVVIVISGISVFGTEELSKLMWPTLELVKITQVPGMVLERLESAFLGVWVAAVFTTTANLYYAATLISSRYVQMKKYRKWFGVAFFPLIYWVALQPENVLELFEWQDRIGFFGVFIGTLTITFLLILAVLRKKGMSKKRYLQQFEQQKENGGLNVASLSAPELVEYDTEQTGKQERNVKIHKRNRTGRKKADDSEEQK